MIQSTAIIQNNNFSLFNTDLFVGTESRITFDGNRVYDSVANTNPTLRSRSGLRLGGCATNITNSSFDRLSSDLSGGAVFFADSDLRISKTNFSENTASAGGSLALSCTGMLVCKYHIEKSLFLRNSATQQGGAISYDAYKPVLSNLGNNFTGNSAIYGNDLAGYPYKMQFVNQYANNFTALASSQLYGNSLLIKLRD